MRKQKPEAPPVEQPSQASDITALTKPAVAIPTPSTPELQRAQYELSTGRSWSADFMTAREARGMTIAGRTGDALVEYLMGGLIDSLWKRVQERFGTVEHFTFPRVTDGATDVTFLTRRELDEQGLLPCILNGERVPLEFAFDLDMLPTPPKRARREPYREMRKSAEFMDTLKSRLNAWSPLVPHSRRVYIQGAPEVGANTPHPNAKSMSPHVIGSFILIREDERAEQQSAPPSSDPQLNDADRSPTGRRLAFAVYPTVYALHRKCIHQESNYQSERAEVGHLRTSWRLMVGRLDREWRRGTPEEAKELLRQELTTLTASTRESLENAEAQLKVESEEFFSKIQSKLAQGDKNIGARMTQMTAGEIRLLKRIEETQFKGRYNYSDRSELNSLITEKEAVFATFREALVGNTRKEGAISVLRREMESPTGYFNTSFTSEEARTRAATIMKTRMGLAVHELQEMRVRPFIGFGRLMALEHTALYAAIDRRDASEAKRAMNGLVTISKLQFANRTFEKLRELLSQRVRVPMSDLAAEARPLRAILPGGNPFPEVGATAYDAPLAQIEAHGLDLVARLNKCEQMRIKDETRPELYKRIRAFLDGVDVEGPVLNLLHGPRA